MKTSVYIENGRTQIILTPENNFEVNIIKTIKERQVDITEYTGSFKDCAGGWIRQCRGEDSLMLLLKENNLED